MAGSLGMVIRSVARAFLEPEHSAIDEIANSLETYRRTGALIQVPFLLTLFGEACLKHRAWQLGLGAMEEALQLALDHGEHQVTPEIYRIQAGLLSGAKIEDGEPYYLKSIELARSQQTRTFELRAAADLAELWMDQGKWVGAHKLLAPVYERFTEGFGMPYLGEAAALLRRLDQNPSSSINAE
jgi:predicted ATPase